MANWLFTIDNSNYSADTADELIEQFWLSSLFGEDNIEDYRVGFAKRLAVYNGSIVRSGTNQELFDDLVKLGFLKQKA
jgi:hypothetical protein